MADIVELADQAATTTLVIEDEEIQVLRWLLADAYWRLDQAQDIIDKISDDDTIDLPGAGRIILEQLQPILADHPHPADRRTAASPRQASP